MKKLRPCKISKLKDRDAKLRLYETLIQFRLVKLISPISGELKWAAPRKRLSEWLKLDKDQK